MNKTTFLHLAAFELLDAVKETAVAFVKAGYIITILYACTPALVVEGITNIFIVALFITIWVIQWMAALSLVNVREVCWWSCAQSEAVQVVTRWAQRPDIKTEKRLKSLSSKFKLRERERLVVTG